MSTVAKARSLATNLVLSAVACFSCYLVIEFVLFPWGLRYLPLAFHGYLDREVQPLAQSSKESTEPTNYVLIVGDSYAQGYGDWLFSVGNDGGNPPFSSAHVIHEQTGRDVVSFGRSGAGSLRSLVEDPVALIQGLRERGRFDLEEPKQVVVYFYEGNDLNNNLGRVAKLRERGWHSDLVDEPVLFNDFLHLLATRHRVHEGESGSRGQSLYALRFFSNMVSRELPKLPQPQWSTEGVGRVRVGGRTRSIPDELQSPALELSAEEFDLAIKIFAGSLNYLRSLFSEAAVVVVYLPSPLASYDLVSKEVVIETYQQGRARRASSEVGTRSDELCRRIEAVAAQSGSAFLDSRPVVLEQTRHGFVHGPMDWWHFNESGYRVLGKLVADYLSDGADRPCR